MPQHRNLHRRGVVYYYKRKSNGKQLWTSLRTQSKREAVKLLEQIREQQILSSLGVVSAPKAPSKMPTLGAVIDFYTEAGCPRKDGSRREGRSLTLDLNNCRNLKRLLGKKDPQVMTPADWHRYSDKRLSEYPEGRGARTVDTEWTTLSAVFRWAMRYSDETGISRRPLSERPQRTQKFSDVKHCRDFQPANADELHAIARYFLERQESVSKGSGVFGWLTLLSAMIGQRCSEMLLLRQDATSIADPGFDDGEHLWLYRSKTHKGTSEFCQIGPELRGCLDAHRDWLAKVAPSSPHFFPSPIDPNVPLKASSFGQSLSKACRHLGLPHRKPHGLRAYYVTVLRSQGHSDSEIALRIGQKSGGKLIVDVYGKRLPIKVGWLPERGAPAWVRE